jgi:ligand-binding sensor protein
MIKQRFAQHMEDLERQIHARFGFNAAAFDPSGARVTGYVNFANPLCARVKGDPAANGAICAVANQHFLREAETTGRPVAGECDAGLCKFGVPVLVEGRFIGMVGGCGRPLADGELDYFAIEKASGIKQDEAETLCRDCPPLSQQDLAAALAFVSASVQGLTT